jgi:hypothetical protein
MARDLDVDLMVCQYANNEDFIARARTGWPETIRELKKAESEIDRLHNELNILQEQLNRRGQR